MSCFKQPSLQPEIEVQGVYDDDDECSAIDSRPMGHLAVALHLSQGQHRMQQSDVLLSQRFLGRSRHENANAHIPFRELLRSKNYVDPSTYVPRPIPGPDEVLSLPSVVFSYRAGNLGAVNKHESPHLFTLTTRSLSEALKHVAAFYGLNSDQPVHHFVPFRIRLTHFVGLGLPKGLYVLRIATRNLPDAMTVGSSPAQQFRTWGTANAVSSEVNGEGLLITLDGEGNWTTPQNDLIYAAPMEHVASLDFRAWAGFNWNRHLDFLNRSRNSSNLHQVQIEVPPEDALRIADPSAALMLKNATQICRKAERRANGGTEPSKFHRDIGWDKVLEACLDSKINRMMLPYQECSEFVKESAVRLGIDQYCMYLEAGITLTLQPVSGDWRTVLKQQERSSVYKPDPDPVVGFEAAISIFGMSTAHSGEAGR